MRILIASDFFHPTIGGAERQVQLLGASLQHRGHQVAIATVRQPGQPERDVVDGVAVHRLPAFSTMLATGATTTARRFLPPVPDPRLVIALRGLLNQLDGVDVVHANGWIGFACAAALERRSEPLVLSVRDYGYSCAVRSLLQRDREICSGPALGKCLDCAGHRYGAAKAMVAVGGVFTGRTLLRRHVRGIHSVSRFVQSIVERDLLAGDAGWRPVLERIPDIVPDASEGELSIEEQGLLDQLPREPFILFVGVLQAYKGLSVLLDAYQRLAAERRPATTLADGPRPGSSATREGAGHALPPLVLIGTRHPDTPAAPAGVTILNDVPHRVVMAAWERSLFGVTPSIWPDPLPGVVREAMTRAKPVIATAVGGNPDMVVDGLNGLLVPVGDAVALATAMGRLLDDPDLRRGMGEAARASVRELTPAAVAARFESLYRQAAVAR